MNRTRGRGRGRGAVARGGGRGRGRGRGGNASTTRSVGNGTITNIRGRGVIKRGSPRGRGNIRRGQGIVTPRGRGGRGGRGGPIQRQSRSRTPSRIGQCHLFLNVYPLCFFCSSCQLCKYLFKYVAVLLFDFPLWSVYNSDQIILRNKTR